jgi:hypothetical protein
MRHGKRPAKKSRPAMPMPTTSYSTDKGEAMEASRCAFCHRGVYGPRFKVWRGQDESAWVGPDCFARIRAGGVRGTMNEEEEPFFLVRPIEDEGNALDTGEESEE